MKCTTLSRIEHPMTKKEKRKQHNYDLSHRSCYNIKNRNDGPYTKKQKKLIEGDRNASKKLKRDVRVLLDKAKARGDDDVAEKLKELYPDCFGIHPDPTYTVEEAAEILDLLSPEGTDWYENTRKEH